MIVWVIVSIIYIISFSHCHHFLLLFFVPDLINTTSLFACTTTWRFGASASAFHPTDHRQISLLMICFSVCIQTLNLIETGRLRFRGVVDKLFGRFVCLFGWFVRSFVRASSKSTTKFKLEANFCHQQQVFALAVLYC